MTGMHTPASPNRKVVIAGAIALALALGAGTYVANLKPAESQVMSASASVSTSASIPAKPAGSGPAHPSTPAASSVAPVNPADAAPQPPAQIRTKEQAAAALMALPELQAWSALLEKNSGGKTHGALIEYDPTPRKINGKSYWQFSFVENSEQAELRWESFLLSSSDEEILVEDANTDEIISLARWRREKHPAKRTSADGG